jgi:hypothetical protein
MNNPLFPLMDVKLDTSEEDFGRRSMKMLCELELQKVFKGISVRIKNVLHLLAV